MKGANIQNIDLGTFKAASHSDKSSSFTWGDAGRIAVGFVPVVGNGFDIYEGARDGNWVQFGIGIGGLALDVATLGAGSVIKGGIKTIGTELIEGGLEMAAKDAAKEIAESEAKQGMKALSREEMAGIWGKGSDYMYSDYNQARNAALKWLDSQGFKAEQKVFGKFGTSEGKAIGMKNANANIGFRVEFDVRSGSHINVFSGKLKGPHFQFKGSEKTLNNIITRFSK